MTTTRLALVSKEDLVHGSATCHEGKAVVAPAISYDRKGIDSSMHASTALNSGEDEALLKEVLLVVCCVCHPMQAWSAANGNFPYEYRNPKQASPPFLIDLRSQLRAARPICLLMFCRYLFVWHLFISSSVHLQKIRQKSMA